MVSELQSQASKQATREIFIAEFGVLTSSQLDLAQRHLGRLYRWAPESMKGISDAVGFNARFDLPAVRSAYMDVWQTEGQVVFEIDRNTRPGDIGVRYARDRFSVKEFAGKGEAGLRPWVKSVYQARFIDEKTHAAMAEALGLAPSSLAKFFARFNFKERTFALIAAERHVESLPLGAFNQFSLPEQGVDVVAVAEAFPEDLAGHLFEAASTGGESVIGHNLYPGASMSEKQDLLESELQTQSADKLGSSTAEVRTALTDASDNVGLRQADQADSAQDKESGAAVSDAASMAPAPLAVSAAQAHGPRKVSKAEAPMTPPPAPPSAAGAQPRSTSGSTAKTGSYLQAEVKYATYSKSEVDYMLKQQAESILSALSGKISAQQRSLQESMAAQEKSFAKLTDNFLTQFDSTRIKLEATAKSAQDTSKSQLDDFQKQLAKELEQYRTQINKTVAPVAKAIENKQLPQAKDAPGKTANLPPKAQAAITAGQSKLEKLVVVTLVLSLVSVAVSILGILAHTH